MAFDVHIGQINLDLLADTEKSPKYSSSSSATVSKIEILQSRPPPP